MNGKMFAALVLGLALVAPAASAQSTAGAPTFTKDVAPIFYKNCTVCHRPGAIAPMSLLTYSDARPWTRSIATNVTRGTMPPWHADPAHGEFLNDRRLSQADKDIIVNWVSAGAPEGNAADLPPQPVYPDGWAIGKPDAIFALNEDYPVQASGTIDYKYFEVPTNLTEDKWIQAFEVKPGDPSVVHHVIVYARPPQRPRPAAPVNAAPPAAPANGAAPQRRQAPFTFAPNMEEPDEVKAGAAREAAGNDRPAPDGGTGMFVGGYTPGQSVRVFQPGSALRLPAGSTIVFQMHYTANGKDAHDRSKIGFVFAKEPPKQEAIIGALVNQNFTLPAGVASTKVDAEMTLNQDMILWSLLPHTHVRGRQWEIQATYPDGRKEVLLSVPNYDFNWQTDYIFKQPLKLPKGTVLHSSAWYDNSAANKSNPNPKADVHWGDQTWEEMQFTAFTFTLVPQAQPATGAQQQ
jgi:mono/diheme cytochrome c family protein